MDIDDEWDSFINDDNYNIDETDEIKPTISNNKINIEDTNFIPKCSDLYISTKSKIYYLNKSVPLDIFWNIKTIDYFIRKEGIIKKQIKYDSNDEENIIKLTTLLQNEPYYNEQIIKHNEINGKFKDIRKITVGLCNKDIINSRTKQKNAFFNCFVIILRIYDDINDIYRESHVKIFNTGKIELPGIKNEVILNKTLNMILNIFKEYLGNDLNFRNENTTILINSNFNCNYYIDRLKMFSLLKDNYGLETMFDPCIYPGIQCKFYYNVNRINNNGQPPKKEINEDINYFVKMSFMIFRTGSILIVGKCQEYVLEIIYNFLTKILLEQYNTIICNSFEQSDININTINKKEKKSRKKYILVNK